MRRTIPKLLAAFLGLCLAASAFAIDVPLKYQKYLAESEDFYPSGTAVVEKTLEPPAGKWKMPQLACDKPIYALIKIGEKELLFVLDWQKKDAKFYNRIYFDSNGNNDLTDDPVLDGAIEFGTSNLRYTAVFSGVDIRIEVDGKSLPYSFNALVYGVRLDQLEKSGMTKEDVNRSIILLLNTNCSYTGEFQINGQNYRVVLGDRDCNGRFNDRLSIRKFKKPPAGRIRVYGSSDGFFITAGDKIDSFDLQVCGDLLLVKDRLFKVSIRIAEGKMTLTPVSENLVSLHLPEEAERLSLYTQDEKHCLVAYQPNKEIKVPAGKYRLYTYQIFKKDKQGDMWRLNAAATTETPFITVDRKGKPVVELGEPYMPLIDVRVRENRSRASIGFNVEGKGKEFVTDLSHISGDKTQISLSEEANLGHRPKEPTYKIVKADGEVVTQGSFRYG